MFHKRHLSFQDKFVKRKTGIKNQVKSFKKPSYEDPPSVPSEEIIATPIEAQIQIDNRNENSFEFLENPEVTGVGTSQGSKVNNLNLSLIAWILAPSIKIFSYSADL